jgi:excisionase family DNA binding protein
LKLLSVKQAALALEVNESTVRRWCQKGRIKHKRVGKVYLFDADLIEQYATGQRAIRDGEADSDD